MKSLSRSLSRNRRTKHNLGHKLTLVLVAIFVFSIPVRADWVGDSRPMMGTEVSVLLWHDDPVAGDLLVEKVFAEAHRIDLLMSTYIEKSRISDINRRAAFEPVAAGDELFQLIMRSLDISVLTRGGPSTSLMRVSGNIMISGIASVPMMRPSQKNANSLVGNSSSLIIRAVRSAFANKVYESILAVSRRVMSSSAASVFCV